MLIPVGVIIKTITGGLSQTYISSLLGSWIIMIVVLVFAFRVYATGDDGLLLGSPAAVWNNLNTYASTPAPENPSQEVKDMKLGPISGASSCSHQQIHAIKTNPGAFFSNQSDPISGNLEGSYMTIYSQGGLSFALINAIGNFGAVFVDQSYFTAAVAASSSASWKSYLLAGALWFSIPFSIATAVGLAARATALPLSGKEASEGLVAPAVAHHFMGNTLQRQLPRCCYYSLFHSNNCAAGAHRRVKDHQLRFIQDIHQYQSN
jgi:Na+/proline symporter